MEPLLRASLATLAALSILGGLSALLRADATRRLERLGLLLHHGVSLGVAVAALLGAVLGGGDGRPLLLCAAGPLLVLCLQDAVPARIALLSVPLVVAGLLGQALVLLGAARADVVGPICAALCTAACAAGAATCWVRRRHADVPRVRALMASQVIAMGLASLSGLVGLLPAVIGGGGWALGVGAAGAVGTAARLQPNAPPGGRDLLAGAVMFSMVLAVGAAAPMHLGQSFIAALWAAQVSVAVFALVRASVDVPRGLRPPIAKEPALDVSLPSGQALAAMTPLLDDAVLRRPGRPRVIARVPARRLLDAALDKARSAQPGGRGRRDELVRVEVVSVDSEIDVDGDPGDLAEALCAVLDNALRSRAQNPDVRVQVHLRGSPAAVTFEISDVLPDGAEPAPGAGIPDADGPFMNPRADMDRPGLGVSLARARVLVERNGGKLMTRSSAEGSTVQLTMPRRIQKGAMGQA